MNKYKFSFKYLDNGRKSFKYIYADSEDEATSIFKEIYSEFSIEIISVEILKKDIMKS